MRKGMQLTLGMPPSTLAVTPVEEIASCSHCVCALLPTCTRSAVTVSVDKLQVAHCCQGWSCELATENCKGDPDRR